MGDSFPYISRAERETDCFRMMDLVVRHHVSSTVVGVSGKVDHPSFMA